MFMCFVLITFLIVFLPTLFVDYLWGKKIAVVEIRALRILSQNCYKVLAGMAQ